MFYTIILKKFSLTLTFDKSDIDEFGGFCCKFSPDGRNVAWTSASQFEHKIVIERFLDNNGKKVKFTATG